MASESEDRVRLAQQLKDIIGDDIDEHTCMALLESNDWVLEATVRKFFEAPLSPRLDAAAPPSRPNHEEEDEDDLFFGVLPAEGVRARRRLSPESGNRHADSSFRTTAAAVSSGPPHANGFHFPTMSMLKEMFTGQQPESASFSARKFASEFDRIVGPHMNVPDFFESSFVDAIAFATTERRMLCVYLHSPHHPLTESFCKTVICSRLVLSALNDVRVWGGNVETCEGYLASSKVQASAFPALILINATGSEPRIVERIYGLDGLVVNDAERVAGRILLARNARLNHTANVAAPSAVSERENEERRRVVREQDAELQRALALDRKREEEKQQLERQQQEAERQRVEQENFKAVELENKRLRILPEPPKGTSGTAELRFQFPGGNKISRRFAESETIASVRCFLDVYLVDQGIHSLRYALSVNFPKRRFLESEEETLKEAGLCPQSMLFVQDLDA